VPREPGRMRLRVPLADAGGRPIAEPYLEAIRTGYGPDFRVLGEVGRALNGRVVFLARDLRRDVLMALRLTPVPDQADEHDLEVARELRDHTPSCGKCGARFRSNGRFCTQCGADASAMQEAWSSDELRVAVQERASERELEILDDIRIPGGRVYFAVHARTRALHALQLEETDAGEFALAVTGMLQQLLAETTAPGAAKRNRA